MNKKRHMLVVFSVLFLASTSLAEDKLLDERHLPSCDCAKQSSDDASCTSRVLETSCTNDPFPKWSGYVEALFWTRSQNFAGGLVLDEDNPPAFALTGSDLRFNPEAGLRASLTRHLSTGNAFEFIFFGVDAWNSTATTTGLNNRSLPGDAGLATFDFFNADAMQVTYDSELVNIEANYTMKWKTLDAIVGFRYFQLDESMSIAAFDADTFTSDYRVSVDNDLYGAQIGLRSERDHCAWTFSVSAKTGIYANVARQRTLFRDLSNTLILRNIERKNTSAASISEISLLARRQITDRMSLRIGYNLLWATNLALAPFQFDFTDNASSSDFIDDGHSTFIHGGSIGLQIDY